jgi:hypothetical protein
MIRQERVPLTYQIHSNFLKLHFWNWEEFMNEMRTYFVFDSKVILNSISKVLLPTQSFRRKHLRNLKFKSQSNINIQFTENK